MSVDQAIAGSIYVIAGLASAMFVGWRISGGTVDQDEAGPTRLLVATVLMLTQLIGVELICATFVILYPPVVAAINALVALAVWRVVPASRWRPTLSRPGLPTAVLGGVLAFCGILAAIMSARGAPTDSDDLEYHLPNAAAWMRIHDLWHLPPANPGYFTNAYPSDGELLTNWVMAPFRGAELATWPTLLFGVLLLLACAMIASQIGRSASTGVLGGAAVLLAPFSWQTQVHSALTDWTSASGLLASVALILRGRSDPRLRWPLLAGMALGIAVGSKDTAAVPALGILLLTLWILPRKDRWRSTVVMLAPTMALAGVWFIRTGIQTGNPIYPEPVRVAGKTLLPGGVSPLTSYSASLVHDFATMNTTVLHTWAHLIRTGIGPPAVLSALVVLVLRRPRQNPPITACTLLAIWIFVGYMATPYTGPDAAFLVGSQTRYAIPALVLAATCAATTFRWIEIFGWVCIGVDLVSISHGSATTTNVAVSASDLAVASLGGALVTGVMWSGDFRATSKRIVAAMSGFARFSATAGGLAIASAAVLATGAVSAIAVRAAPVPSAFDRAISDRSGQLTGESLSAANQLSGSGNSVMVIGDTNLFSALGARLNENLVTPARGSGNEIPVSDPRQLDAIVESLKPVGIVVGPQGQPGVIPGWTPPGYTYVGTANGNREYVATPPVPPTPVPPTTAPTTPPTTLPTPPPTPSPSTPSTTLP